MESAIAMPMTIRLGEPNVESAAPRNKTLLGEAPAAGALPLAAEDEPLPEVPAGDAGAAGDEPLPEVPAGDAGAAEAGACGCPSPIWETAPGLPCEATVPGELPDAGEPGTLEAPVGI